MIHQAALYNTSKMPRFVLLAVLMLSVVGVGWGQSRMPAAADAYLLSAYRSNWNGTIFYQDWYGDADKVQVIFFEVDATVTDPLYFGIYDPGMDATEMQGTEDPGDMWYRVYGGAGAFTGPNSRNLTFYNTTTALEGSLLDELIIPAGNSALGAYNNQWVYGSAILPSQGELVGNKRIFKFVVVGGKNPDLDSFTDQDNDASGNINGDDFMNLYQVAVSSGNSGNPVELPGVRSFAYSLSVNLSGTYSPAAGPVWNLYPFVPENTNDAWFVRPHSFDADYRYGNNRATPNGALWTLERWNGTVYSGLTPINLSNDTFNTPGPGFDTDGDPNNAPYTATGQHIGAANGVLVDAPTNTGHTWRFIMRGGSENGGTDNGVDIWATIDSSDANLGATTTINPGGGTPLRIYSQEYKPALDTTVQLSLTDGVAKTVGDFEAVSLQVVDAGGNSVPYSRYIWVETSGTALISWVSDKDRTLALANQDIGDVNGFLIRTDDGGSAQFRVINGTVESITVRAYANGSANLPGNDPLETNYGQGAGIWEDSETITFSASLPPTISSASNTNIAGLNTTGNLARLTLTVPDTGYLPVAGPTNYVWIRIPSTVNATFASRTLTYVDSGAGSLVSPNYVVSKVIRLTVDGTFAAGNTVRIGPATPNATDSIGVVAGTTVESFSLRFSWDSADGSEGNGTWITDDKIISIIDTSNYTWGGVTSTNWATDTNWSPQALAPPSGATVSATITNQTNDPILALGANLNLNNLTLLTGASLQVTGGTNSITLAGNLVLASGSTLNVSGATSLTIAGNLTVGTGATLTLGTCNLNVTGTVSNNGTIQLTGAGAQTITLTNDVDSGTWEYTGTTAGLAIKDLSVGTDYFNLLISGTGSFTSPTTLSIAGSFTRTAGIFAHSSGTVSLVGTGIHSLSGFSGTSALNNLTQTGAGTYIVGSALDLANTLSVSAGNFNISSRAIGVGGSVSLTGSSNLTTNATTAITLTGTTAAVNITTTSSGADTLPELIVGDGTNAKTATLLSAITLGDGLTVRTNGGVLALGSFDLALTGALVNNGTVTLLGSQTVSLGSGNDVGSGTWVYTGTGNLGEFGATDYYNLTLASGSNITVPASGITVAGALNVGSGTAVALTNTGALTVTGTTTINIGTGTNLTLDNTANNFSTVLLSTVNNATIYDVNALELGTSVVSGALSIRAGGAITDSATLTVTGQATFETRAVAGFATVILDDDNAGGYSNNFGSLILRTLNVGGTLAVATNITVYENSATNLAGLRSAGSVLVSSAGIVSDSGPLLEANLSVVSIGGTVFDLANTLTGFAVSNTGSGAVSLSANTATNLNVGAITMGAGTGAITILSTGNVDVSGAVAPLAGQNVIIRALGAGSAFSSSATIGAATGIGTVTLSGDTMALGAAVQSGSGAITLEPAQDSTSLALNDATGIFSLDSTELAYLATSGLVTLGRNDSIAAINVGSAGTIDLSTETWAGLTIQGLSSNLAFNFPGAGDSLSLPSARTLTLDLGGAITSPGNATNDITIAGASVLDLVNVTTVGASAANRLTSSVATLRMAASGAAYIGNATAIAIGDATRSVSSSGGNIDIRAGGNLATGAALSTTGGDGALILSTTSGNININHNTSANGSGALDFDSAGIFTLADGIVLSTGTGIVTVDTAGGDLTINGDITTAGAGTLTLNGSGSISMDASSLLQSANGAITLSSSAGNVMHYIVQSTGSGPITLSASAGTISEVNNSARLGATGSTSILDLTAGTTIGSSGTGALNTNVGVLRVAAGGAVYVNEATALQLGDLGVGNDVITTAGGLDISAGGAISTGNTISTSGANAPLTLTSTSGGIQVSHGTSTHGSGAIDINSAAGFSLGNGITVSSTSGNVTIDTSGTNDLLINGTISTGGTGSVLLTASRDIIMDIDSRVETASGAITLDADSTASSSLVLDEVQSSGSATITLRAGPTGTITEVDNSAVVSTAGTLIINDVTQGSTVGAAAGNGSLNTNVGTLIARTGGGLYINETNALILGAAGAGNIVTSNAGPVSVVAGGTISTGNAVSTTGTGTTLTLTTSAGDISIGHGLTSVGAISIDAFGQTYLGANITSANTNIRFWDAVRVTGGGSDVAVSVSTGVGTVGNIQFDSTVDSDRPGNTLTLIAGTGTVSIAGAVGTLVSPATDLLSLTVSSASLINLQSVFTNGSQSYTSTGNITLGGASYRALTNTAGVESISFNGPVLLGANVAIQSPGIQAGDSILFGASGTINDDAGTTDRTLSVTAGAGTITFGAPIGGVTAPLGITVVYSSDLDFDNTVNLGSSGLVVNATTTDLAANLSTDAIAATAGPISITGNLTTSAALTIDTNATSDGSLTVSGTVITGGDLTLDLGTTNLTGNVGSNFGTVVVTSANNITLNDSNGIILGTSTISGDLIVNAGGHISDSGALNITGTTGLMTSVVATAILDEGNNFGGAVSAGGSISNLTLNDTGALRLGTVAISGNLVLTSSGLIDQTASTVSINGTSSFTAGLTNSIVLTQVGNDFNGAITVLSANNVSLVDTDDITLGSIAANGAILVDTNTINTAPITIAGAVGNGATTSITLNTPGGAGDTIILQSGSFNTAGTVTLSDNTVLNSGGTFTLTAGTLDINANLSRSSGTLALGANPLRLLGNMTWAAGTLSSSNTITLDGTSLQAVNLNGANIQNLTLDNTNGATFNNTASFTWSGDLTLTSGALTLANLAQTIGGSVTGTGTLVSPTSSTLTVAGASWNVGTLTPGNGTIDFSAASTIASSNTFYNLNKSTAGLTLLNAGATVSNNLTVSGGTLRVPAAQTLTVSASSAVVGTTVNGGTLDLVGSAVYAGESAMFLLSSGAVTVDTGAFAAGSMTANGGTFTQEGANALVDDQILASLSIGASGSVTWDSSVAGGDLVITGNVTNAGSLVFNNKNVTIGGSITGNYTLYDLTILAGTTLTRTAGSNLTVLRNLTIQNTGNYVHASQTLTLGGGLVTGGTLQDQNTGVNPLRNLGVVNLVAGGVGTVKTLGTGLLVNSITIPLNVTLNLADQNLTSTGTISGAGTLAAAAAGNAEQITVGGDFTVASFTPANSRVIFNGATAASINHPSANYTFWDLEVAKTASSDTLTLNEDLTVDNGLTLTSGRLLAGANILTIDGDWNSSQASFTFTATEAGTSTVVLRDAAPTITTKPTDRFYHLTLNNGATTNSNVTVLGNFTATSSGGGGTLDISGDTLTVAGNVNLDPAATGATLTSTGSTLILNGTANQNITSNNQSWNNLTISTSGTGTVDFIDQLNTLGSITTSANPYNVEFSAGGSSIGAWTFNNTGTLSIPAGYTFNDGVTATAPSSVSVAGTIATSNDPMSLGSQGDNRPVNLVGASILQTGGGNLTVGPINNASSQTLQLIVGAGTLDAQGTIGGGTALTSLTLTSAGNAGFARGIRTSGNINLSNSGVLTLGDPDAPNDTAGDNISTSAGNFSQTGASSVSISADFNIVGTVDFISPVALSDDVRITATGTSTFGALATINNLQPLILAGNGNKVLNGAIGNLTPLADLTLSGTGTKTFAATVALNSGSGDLLIDGSTGLVLFQNTFGANSVTQNDGANPLQFDADVTLGAGTSSLLGNTTLDGLTFQSAGSVSFGNTAADTLTLSGGTVVMTGAGLKTFNAVVSSAVALDQANGSGAMDFNENVTTAGGSWEGNITLGGMTLSTSALLTIGSAGGGDTLSLDDGTLTLLGAGDYVLNAPTNGAQNLIMDGAGTKTFNASVGAVLPSLTGISQVNNSGAVDFNENVSISGTAEFLGDLTLGGMTLTVGGVLTIGTTDADGDGNNTGADTLTIEDGAVTITTVASNTAQTFYGAIGGNQTLTVQAGTSSARFTGVISGITGLTVNASTIAYGNDTVDSITLGGAGVLSFTATGTGVITLRGSSITTPGTQTYTANSKVVADLHANGAWDASSPITVTSPWFFLDSQAGPTVTLSLPDGLNASEDVALYRGSLNIASRTLDVNGNLAMFGGAYNADDPDRTAPAEYIYPDQVNMNTAHAFPGTNASFGLGAIGLAGATLDVAGNFYANGINLNPGTYWSLVIPENYISTSNYASAYYLAVANGQVSAQTGGTNKAVVSASVIQAPYTNNGITAGSALAGANNMQPDWIAPAVPASPIYCGWDFYDVRIAAVRTVYDNLIEVYFTRPIRNSNGEIAAAVALPGTFFRATNDPDGAPTNTPAFSSAYRYTDPTNRDFNGNDQLDLGDLTLITVGNTADLLGNWIDNDPLVDSDGDGTLTNDHDIDDPLFLLAPFTWNTDASGSTAVGAANSGRGALGSTNRAGVGQDRSLDLSLMKGALVSAYGKNPVIKYGDNGVVKYTAATDGTSPVLVGTWAGQHNGTVGTAEPYNRHNFLHFRYSEPIDLSDLDGTDASGNAQDGGDANASGTFPLRSRYNNGTIAGSTADRFGVVRGVVPTSEVDFFKPFDDAARVAGSTDIATGVVVDGLGLEYGNAATIYNFGSRIYDGAAAHVSQADKSNLIYRSASSSTENPAGAHGITIFLAGYSAGGFWPGFLGDPFTSTRNTPAAGLGIRQLNATAAEQAARQSSSMVRDASGNLVEPTSNIYAGKKNGTTGLTIRNTATAAVTLVDVEAGGAGFGASFRNDWDTAPLEIKPFGTGLEIHTELSITTGKMSTFHVVTMNDIDADGAESGAEAALGDGIRDSSWLFPSPRDLLLLNNPLPRSPPPTDSKDELMAFGFTDKTSAVAADDFKYNLGMATTVTIDSDYNPLTPNVNFPDSNDRYFSIIVDSSPGTGNPWGSITTVKVSYSGLGFLTDHAGNVLPLFSEKDSIERTPPNIKLSLAAVGGNRIYVEFDEPVYHWDGSDYSTIQAADFLYKDVVDLGASVAFSSVEVLSTLMTSVGIAGATSAYLYLPLGTTVGPDDAYELRINSLNSVSVIDKGGNPMQATQDYRFSNIGIGLVNPVYAVDDWINPEFGSSIKALRDFTGKESMSGEGAISIQAKSHDSQKAGYKSTPLSLWFDVNVPGAILAGPGKFWSPIGIPGFADSPNGDARLVNEKAPATIGIHDFTLPPNDSEFKTDALIQFVMTQNGIPLGWTPDPDKPEQVRPWAFKFGAVIDQRSGVSILNNVINPTAGDKAVLQYHVKLAGNVNIIVYTLDGNVVKTLQRGRQGQGDYKVLWDGKNGQGDVVARGLYLIRVVGPGFDEYRKVLVVK